MIGTGNYNGRKAIYTSTTVYQFDNITSNPYSDNSWSSFNGDMNNTRKLDLDYEFFSQDQSIINRSYCYPNPIRDGSGIIRIETNSGEKVEVMLYDLAGFYIDSYSSNIGGLEIKFLSGGGTRKMLSQVFTLRMLLYPEATRLSQH